MVFTSDSMVCDYCALGFLSMPLERVSLRTSDSDKAASVSMEFHSDCAEYTNATEDANTATVYVDYSTDGRYEFYGRTNQ